MNDRTTLASGPAAGSLQDAVAPGSLRKLAVILLLAALVLAAVHLTPLGKEFTDVRRLLDRLDDRGLKNELIFLALVAGLVAAGMPRLMFFVFGGVLFGFVEGFLAALGGSLVGSFLTFHAVRWGGAGWVRSRFGGRKFYRRITSVEPSVAGVVLARQLPISNLFINVCLALSTVSGRTFLLGSLVGFCPQGLVASLIGSGMVEDQAWEGFVQLAFAAMMILGICVWISLKRRKKLRHPHGLSS